ncbi:hypothetical protein JB92DRAFT_2839252 [Gautieria morchelliformis]|nr:hypothetical protein JB92DRAFT_2839252 [Gautieria morchelliformis]
MPKPKPVYKVAKLEGYFHYSLCGQHFSGVHVTYKVSIMIPKEIVLRHGDEIMSTKVAHALLSLAQGIPSDKVYKIDGKTTRLEDLLLNQYVPWEESGYSPLYHVDEAGLRMVCQSLLKQYLEVNEWESYFGTALLALLKTSAIYTNWRRIYDQYMLWEESGCSPLHYAPEAGLKIDSMGHFFCGEANPTQLTESHTGPLGGGGPKIYIWELILEKYTSYIPEVIPLASNHNFKIEGYSNAEESVEILQPMEIDEEDVIPPPVEPATSAEDNNAQEENSDPASDKMMMKLASDLKEIRLAIHHLETNFHNKNIHNYQADDEGDGGSKSYASEMQQRQPWKATKA